MTKQARKSSKAGAYRNLRAIPWPTKVLLVARAAGQCQFPGCGKRLFEHHLTLKEGNFAQLAHIVAFSPGGPRARGARSGKTVHDVENLMLLCPEDHKLVDDHEVDYPAATLRKYKEDHEARIKHLIGLSPKLGTAILQFKARIGGQQVDIPVDDITLALAPRYPMSKPGTVIDLNALNSEEASYYDVATKAIEQKVREFYDSDDAKAARHVSVFALGPIPLLVALGNALSSTITAELYQRRRKPETWAWRTDGAPVTFNLRKIRAGTQPERIALALSLSGQVDFGQLPPQFDATYSLYEIRPVNTEPTATLVQRREDLENFKGVYHQFLGLVTIDHPTATSIALFPAVPAPVAIMCGRELLRKKHPQLAVWDLKMKTKEYTLTIRVN